VGLHLLIKRAALTAAVALAVVAAPGAARADTIPGTWSSEATLPTTPFWQDLAASRTSDHLIATISVSKGGIRDGELYNPTTQTFTPMATPPIVVLRSSTSLAWGADGYLYLVQRGVANGVTVLRLERYAVGTNTWTRLQKPPIAPGRLVTGSGDNKVILIGPHATFAYQPATNHWKELATMPTPVMDPAATKVGNLIYVVGGTTGTTESSATSITQIYNPTTNHWSTGVPSLHRRIDASATQGADGKLYVLGGTDLYGRAVPWVDVYDPATQTWKGSAPTHDSPFSAALGSDGRLHTFGGYIPGTVTIRTGDVEASPTQAPSETHPPVFSVRPAPVIVTPRSLTNTRPVTVNVVWMASDPSGICFARVESKVNSGAWTDVGVTEPGAALSGTAPYATFVKPATNVRFRVSLTDCTGISTTWADTPTFNLAIWQETSAHFTGSWTAAKSSSALGGGFKWSHTPGDAATLSFNAAAIAWVSTNPPGFDGGTADISIDGGKFTGSVSTVGIRNVIFSKRWASQSAHTMSITVDPSDTTPVTVDGFILLHLLTP